MLWARSVAVRVAQCGLSRTSSTVSGNSGVSTCVLAILEQHKAFLRGLDDDVYTFHSPLVGGSVGQHTRHSLDHLRKPLELLTAQRQGIDERMVHYDIRGRHTPVETDRNAAIEQIEQLEKTLQALPQSSLTRPVNAAFMLSADGQEFDFESTFSRELAFAVHHCIHHNALSKVLLRHHFPDVNAPDGFGMAPSTANFNLTHPQE
ncbi:FK506-binding protein 5 [Phytophthora citrophthora]|uniref:FK506-binding protein 5 n=1 Tax=Phytophthora citrophthora TaxID=4793 RepID=A0AAD9LQI1_9STRA|nr:FK506-binding protein 5 [Phytophthora citrophthora]